MKRCVLFRGLLLSSALSLLWTAGAAAQSRATVSGRVLNGEDLEPLEGVLVILRDTRFRSSTGEDGAFAFHSVPPGSYLLRLEHRGIEGGADSLRVEDDGDLDLEIRLTPDAAELAPLTLEIRSRARGADRTRGSRRNVVTREEIDEVQGTAMHLGDVLQAHVPGISVREQGGAGGYFCVEFRRPVSLADPMGCHPPAVVVDGVSVSDPLGYLNRIELVEIEAVEVVPGAEAGTRYGSSAGYGVILIRTRRPGGTSRRRLTASRTAYDWDRESGTHPWKKTFVGAAAGTAAAVGLVLGASGDCSPLNDERAAQCPGGASIAASVAGVALPVVAGAAGANLLGRTGSSRGDLLRSVIVTGGPMLLGYVLATPRNGGTPSGPAAALGRALVVLGVPTVATLADRFFRSRDERPEAGLPR